MAQKSLLSFHMFAIPISYIFLHIFLNLIYLNSCRAFVFDRAHGDSKFNRETQNEPSYFRYETGRQASLCGDLDQSSLHGQLRTLPSRV